MPSLSQALLGRTGPGRAGAQTSCDRVAKWAAAGFLSPPSVRLASDSERLPLGDVKYYLNGRFHVFCHTVPFFFFF